MHWSSQPEIQVKVSGLPQDVTTLEIYDIFSKEGRILRLDIISDTQGVGKGMAFVGFRYRYSLQA